MLFVALQVPRKPTLATVEVFYNITIITMCTLYTDCFFPTANYTGLVRLVNGEHHAQGNVEVRLNLTSPWGSICGNGWDINDAKVICRQLGYLDALAATVQSSFGTGSGRIWLDNLQCTGNENQITECTHSRWGVSNSHCGLYGSTQIQYFGVAGVVCRGKLINNVIAYLGYSVKYCFYNVFLFDVSV